MTNTLFTLRWMAAGGFAILALAGWAYLTLLLTDFAWWGMALYVAPVIGTPIAFAIRADLKAKKSALAPLSQSKGEG